MRLFAKVSIALVVLLAVLFGALAIGLPRLIESEGFGRSLRANASAVLGRPVEWDALRAGVFPPRLVIESPRIESEGGQTDASRPASRLRADAIDLRMAWLPLLQRRVEVDSLVFRGLDLVVTRTADGFELPVGGAGREGDASSSPDSPDTTADEGATSPAPAPGGAPVDGADLGVALRRFVIEGGRIVVVDRTLAHPIEWRLEDVELEGREQERSGAAAIELHTRLAADGRDAGSLHASGTIDLGGAYDLDLDLTQIALAELQPYVEDVALAGAASGRISVAGAASSFASSSADLVVEDASIGMQGVTLRGRLAVQAERAGEAPLAFRGTLDAGEGGRIRASGTRAPSGGVQAEIELDAVDVTPFAPLAGGNRRLGGQASGHVALTTRDAGGLARLEGEVDVASARLVDGGLDLAGRLAVAFDLQPDASGGPVRMAGRAVLSEARVRADRVDLAGRFELGARREATEPIALTGEVALVDGGRVSWTGNATEEGRLDLNASLAAFDLAIAAPFLPDPSIRMGGRATGKARIVGPLGALELLSLDVDIESGQLETPDYGLSGPLHLTADLREPTKGLRGDVVVDLTRARLSYGESFRKPAGVRATAATKLARTATGGTAFESVIALRNAERIVAKGALDGTTSIVLTAPAFDVKGWDELLPALAAWEAEGPVALEGLGLRFDEQGASRFEGRLELRDVGVRVSETGRVRLRGAIVGEGSTLRSDGLQAVTKGVVLAVDARVEDPFDVARFELGLDTVGAAEANDLVSAFTSRADTVFGPLALNGRLRGALSGGSSFYDALEGQVRFGIGEPGGGRLRGVSLLRTVLDQLPLLGGAARLTQPFRGGRSLDDWFTEYFERIEGDLAIGGGRIEARTLRLVYPGYEATLRGPLRLDDLTLDMKGELILKADLVTALRGATSPSAPAPVAGADPGTEPVAEPEQRKPIHIPLARVRGRLGAPEVSMTPETLLAVPKLLFQATGLDTLSIGVGKAIGRALGAGN
ncbi:MAG: DUF748 domain-containing protein [Myxococcales bacterium]|nr:DUF748 domain-containing protein [Myxococcales bacterium]